VIERLAAAYGAGELPDYMLEFVDSLRMHDANDFLSQEGCIRPAGPPPRPVPKIRGPRQRDLQCPLFQRLSVLQTRPATWSPSV
jgi:hypothetical protein